MTSADTALTALATGERAWAGLDLPRRADLLEDVAALAVEHAREWVDAAAGIKGLDPGSPLLGEEWLSGPYAVATGAAALAWSLWRLAGSGSPLDGARFHDAPDGRVAVDVFPLSVWDRLLLSGFSAQVWLQPGVTRQEAVAHAGLAQRDPAATGGIGVVLGAGNITAIAVLDTLYELIAHNRVVALKLNPIMDPLLPVVERVLAPFVALGAVRVLTGGADVGSALIAHPGVAHVHITGSARTHDAIVFGTGPDADRRRRAGEPVLTTPISSELGGVSPTIVVPDRWTSRDIVFQAAHLATQRLHNGGYNCIATQVVVLPAGWPRREEFLAALRRAFDTAPARPAYYPGGAGRLAAAIADNPGAEYRGNGRVLLTGLRPDDLAPVLTTEYFAPVLAVIDVPGAAPGYLPTAAAFVNERLAGTLGANVLIHPSVARGLGPLFDAFLAELRYGTVAVNAWTGVGFSTATASWGAFPGATLADVQSGIGVVHNALLIDRPERTVVRGPFRPLPRSLATGQWSISPVPPWFVTNRTAAGTARRMVEFAGDPSVARLPAIFASALRG